MKIVFFMGIFSIVTISAMDKEGEILFYRYFNGTEIVREFKQSAEGKKLVVSKVKNTATKKVRWSGKVSDLSSKKASKPTTLPESEVKDIYKKLLCEHQETEKIYAQERIGYGFLI